MMGLVGTKIGMTRFFTKEGVSFSITVILIRNNLVTQIKTVCTDSYNAIQVTTGNKKKNRILKSEIGHYLKSNIPVGVGLWEFRCKNSDNFMIGQIIKVDFFKNIEKVDVTGISKGKGFAGTVKRWNFSMQDATHGNSLSHRVPGSIGQNQTPGRVFKGKKMSGHLGNTRITIQNVKIIEIDLKKKLLFLKGSIPGYVGSYVSIKPSIKLKFSHGVI